MTKTEKIKNIIKKNSYRVSTSHWAGGNHTTNIKIGLPAASGLSETAWSGNGKWSGKNSIHNITVKNNWLRNVYKNKIAVIAGLITVDAKKLKNRVFAATWIEQGRGFDLKLVSGYIIRGYHIKTQASVEIAERKVTKIRLKSAGLIIKNRLKNVGLKAIFVSVQDSLAAGNCPAGTKIFLNQVVQKFGRYAALRADLLLTIRDDFYVRRAILAAKSHCI